MRIAIGGIIHETSTFVRTRTTLADFSQSRGIARGAEILAVYTDTNVCTGGFLDGARRFDFEPVPLLRADAWPGGLIVRADYEALRDELCERLRQADAEARLDGVLLDLHGAMVVDGIDDGDGDVVAAVRNALGPDRPIVFTQDLHGNHTRLRVSAGDALIGFDTFPHVDMAERGLEAAELIARTVRGEIRPVMAIHQLPLFWATSKQVTAHPPMDEVIRQVHALETRPGILCVTVATGFPWADVPEVGSSVVVVADGNRELAQQTADELAAWIWERRDRWYAEPVTVREALAAGEHLGRYPVILADHTDNTGGGSPGDSTEMLRTFLELHLTDALLLYMVDPEVVQQAHQAGPGARISVRLGGKSAPIQGPPIETEAEIVTLSDGAFAYDGPMFAGLKGNLGPSARLQIEGVTVVVVTGREQPLDMAFARSLGLDCSRMRVIGLKSSAHFRAAFEPIAGSIYNIDAAGIHTHVYPDLPHHKRTRPVFPVEIRPGQVAD
jgi:microcystin degradation protein MlrC